MFLGQVYVWVGVGSRERAEGWFDIGYNNPGHNVYSEIFFIKVEGADSQFFMLGVGRSKYLSRILSYRRSSMIVALASPRIASTLDEGLAKIKRFLSEASAQGAEIACFPEAYLPGLRGQDFEVLLWDQTEQDRALQIVAQWARTYKVATILGMERLTTTATTGGRQIVAFVIDAQGQIQGYQTKNQLDPTEDQFYVPGNTRRLFEINGIKFGVAICHEGWRYPETVRWAAVRGAKIVFHPHHTGSDRDGVRLTEWGAGGPYYEKAMMCRSMENTIYFASVNYALRFQESATSLIAPSGQCQAYLPYGHEGVLVQEIQIEEATGLLATRYAPERYQESTGASSNCLVDFPAMR